jgi:tetratricopeptide (TPR) repeat protein
MKMPASKKWRCFWEVLFVLVVLVVVWKGGASHLDMWRGPAGSLTNDLFIPAVMMNAGYGFSNVDPASVPGLRPFLDFQSPAFEIGKIPSSIETFSLHPYQEFHRYLIYTVALTWRIHGITWDGVKILLLAYLFFSCLAVYGICRLAMHPVLALLVVIAFIYSPAVGTTLPILRDFAKAPFILATVFLLGIIVFRKSTPKRFLLWALLVGILLGAGMGIRRDMMLFVPISVVFLFLGGISTPKYSLCIRLSAVAVLLAAFVLVGWPIHKSLLQSGYLAAHDTIMGFSSFSDHELGLLEPASYAKHYLLNDMYSTIKAHYAAGLGATFPESVYQERAAEPDFDFEVKRAYVQKIIWTFPGDMLSRAYAAVMRTTTGITPTPFGIERYGFWFTCIALVLIAAQSPIRAWLLLTMLCYFCGYTSIQFATRHAFHTSFVPFFFLGFLLHHVGLYLWRWRSDNNLKEQTTTEPLWRPCTRAILWTLITALIFLAPLKAAQYLQYQKVEALRIAYETADLEPVGHTLLVWDGKPLIAPTETVRADGFEGKCLLADFETGIVVAAFENAPLPLNLQAVYEWSGGIGDFGGPLHVSAQSNGHACTGNLYFPVYEKTNYGTDWSRFVGLSMPEDIASCFRGFYKVKNLNAVNLLFNMLITEKEEDFVHFQRLSIPWNGSHSWCPYPFGSGYSFHNSAMQIKTCIANKDSTQAIALAEKAIKQCPGSILFTTLLAEAYEMIGEIETSYSTCKRLLRLLPRIPAAYEELDKFFDRQGGATKRMAFWTAILDDSPTLLLAKEYLEKATAECNAGHNIEEGAIE